MTATAGAARSRLDQRLADLPLPVLLGVGSAVAAAAVAGALLGASGPTPGPVGMTVAFALTFTPLGVFVMRRLPGHPLGKLMAAVGVTAALASLAVAWSDLLVAAWFSQWAWWPPVALIPLLLLLVPDGRLPAARSRHLVRVLLVASGAVAVALAVAALFRPRTLLSVGEFAPDGPLRVLLPGAVVALGVVVLATLAVLVTMVGRWRAAPELERRQLACLAPAAALLVIGIGLDALNVPYGWLPAVVALPIGLTVAVLRYQLHDLDLYVHRGAVWAILTAVAAMTYAGVVTLAGATFTRPDDPTASVLAAVAVAAILQPGQRLAQRAVGRFLYGRRDEPYAVIVELGRHLGSIRDPLAVLPEIATTIVDGLRVPYAAVRVLDDTGTITTAAERGRWAGPPEVFPMTAHGRPVGELLVAPRRVGTRFSGAETGLLRDLAGQAAAAAEACRSSIALQRARDRLVLAREEERRRLRRDLHDGVASALVGTRMVAEAARHAVPAEGRASTLLDHVAADLTACTAAVRELIDGLRPAALDDGLAVAIGSLVERTAGHGPAVTLRIDDDLGELPAAVEVAAYRVVAEALANVVKHAQAQTVRVEVHRDARHLDVHVQDDGTGMPAITQDPAGPPTASADGVGLLSMRERAAELGGRVEIDSGAGGTRLQLLLPVEG